MEAAYRSPAGPFKLPRRGHFFAAQSAKKRSPLRTDSLPFVSKIYWPENADDAIMDAPCWLEPIGFAKFAPALREDPGGCESADHPKIARTTEGGVRSKSLFGSGLAGLGSSPTLSGVATSHWSSIAIGGTRRTPAIPARRRKTVTCVQHRVHRCTQTLYLGD